MSKIYKSKISTNHKKLERFKKELSRFLLKNKSIYCKALKRNIYLDKLPEAILNRKSSVRKRSQCFDAAIDIIKNSQHYTSRVHKKNYEYQIIGHSNNKKEVEIHIREEITSKKDRKLFFVSCFSK